MRILLLLLSIFSSYVSASTYTWRDPFYRKPYPSATAACVYVAGVYGYSLAGLTSSPNGDYTCYRIDEQGNKASMGSVERSGDSCPDKTVYNTDKGSCDAPPEDKCASLKDTSIPSFKWDSNSDLPPASISSGGCEATITKGKCYYASTGKAVCNGTATFTGKPLDSNPGGAQVSDCTGADCTSGSPQPETKNQDCVYSSGGSGSTSCTSINSQSNPGTAQCGSVNGAYTCIESPKATSQTSTLNSTKTPTSNPDGTLTIVQDDTVTTVKCSGRSCTTTKTNSSGATVTTSSGQVVSHSSSCTGPQCSPSGSATPSTGAGTGTGTGTGSGEEDEGDDEGASAGTLTDPSNGNFDGQASDWDGKIDKAKKDLKDGIDKIKDSFKPLGDVSLGGGGGQLYCPPATTIPYLNITLHFCLNEYASSLQWLSSAIFAGCALLALFIVFA